MVRQSLRKTRSQPPPPPPASESPAQGAKKEVAKPAKANGLAGSVKQVVKKTVAAPKRKAAPAPDYEAEEHASCAEEDEEERPQPAKKRKTAVKSKKEEGAGAMPLAERTSVSSLKKAMYIGAHVSSAGR